MTTAQDLTIKLGGRWYPRLGYGSCRCPVHADVEPSLSIRDGERGPTFKCHAGCDGREVARALNMPRRRAGWGSTASTPTAKAAPVPEPFPDSHAAAIWTSCRPLLGSLAETYLRSRAITIPADRLRFHPALKHGPSGRYWPAMVALVTTGIDDVPTGIHRTYLAKNGAIKAPVKPVKMMLGTCAGSSVRLAPAAESLLIGEGIETTLSAMQLVGRPGWAALSTSGLKALRLPTAVRQITILVDGDEAGEEAARVASTRWLSEGRRVRLARAPQGQDFNDLLIAERAA